MSGIGGQAAVFVGSLALISVSSFVLTVLLEKIGAGLKLSEGLLGLLTALGADSPEISSSITAISAGHHELGLAVVLGSNIFNLAVLLGLSALIAGLVRVRTAGAILNGGVALLASAIAGMLLLGWISATAAIALIVLVLAPYVWIIALPATRVAELPLPAPMRIFLSNAVQHVQKPQRKHQPSREARFIDWLALAPALFAIVAGSQWLVSSTISLAEQLSISHAIAGTLGVAALTGIPNAIAAIRLALRGRGSAVETECFNSNTLNLVFGICLPALLTGVGAPSSRTYFALGWLALMTILAIVFLGAKGGLRRTGGSILLALYVIFAIAVCFWPQLVG